MNEFIALGLIIFAGVLILVFTAIQRKATPVFREIKAFTNLKRAIGLSVEDGARIHVSLGRGGLQTAQSASGLSGLSMLRHLAELTSVSDKPPLVTSGDGALSILSGDTLKSGYKAAGSEELYDPSTSRLTGLSPFSYAAGAIPSIRDENISLNVLIGHYGPEVALLSDSAERSNSILVAAADEPTAQAILFASVKEPLVGEELFAAGAYTNAGATHRASLRTQDFLRWLIILALISASALKLLGVF